MGGFERLKAAGEVLPAAFKVLRGRFPDRPSSDGAADGVEPSAQRKVCFGREIAPVNSELEFSQMMTAARSQETSMRCESESRSLWWIELRKQSEKLCFSRGSRLGS